VTNSLGSSTVGKWKDICKTGDGNLTFSTAVSGKSLCVKKGGVVIDCGQAFGGTNFAAIAGLIEGCNTTYTPGDAQNDFVNMTAFTNRVQLSPTLAYYNGAYGDKAPVDKSNYYTYSGYIWNRASTNVNWTFALAIGTVSRITIDQKTTYIGNGATGEVGIKTFELTPGPHRIVIAMRSNSDARSTARYFTNEKATWPKSYFGVGIDKFGRGSNNQADYEKLVDPGDGSLLTWALPEDLPCVYPGTDEIVESIVPVRFDEMEFHPETTIDFVDLPDYSVENLMGTPNVAGSSNLTVTGVWAIPASSIAAGSKLTTSGRLIFAEGSKIVISGSSSEFRKVTADVALIVAEASEGVTGTPSVETDCTDGADLARWRISVSDRCISAVRSPYGLKIMVR
jgi:hypothetical protein